MNTEINISLPCEINEILTRIMEHGGEAYIVGGAIRDALLGRPINDWDIATSLKPDDIERLFSHTRTISVGKKYGTVIVIMNGKPIQVTTYRGEENISISAVQTGLFFCLILPMIWQGVILPSMPWLTTRI